MTDSTENGARGGARAVKSEQELGGEVVSKTAFAEEIGLRGVEVNALLEEGIPHALDEKKRPRFGDTSRAWWAERQDAAGAEESVGEDGEEDEGGVGSDGQTGAGGEDPEDPEVEVVDPAPEGEGCARDLSGVAGGLDLGAAQSKREEKRRALRALAMDAARATRDGETLDEEARDRIAALLVELEYTEAFFGTQVSIAEDRLAARDTIERADRADAERAKAEAKAGALREELVSVTASLGEKIREAEAEAASHGADVERAALARKTLLETADPAVLAELRTLGREKPKAEKAARRAEGDVNQAKRLLDHAEQALEQLEAGTDAHTAALEKRGELVQNHESARSAWDEAKGRVEAIEKDIERLNADAVRV